MKTPARLALSLLGPCLAACTPPAAVPAQRASTLPTIATAAPRGPEAPPTGEPVLVSQRLPGSIRPADLDSSGRLALVQGNYPTHRKNGLHVVDVETGQVRGERGGCADQALFAPEGHAVISTCQAEKTLRIWDLTTDTTREIALSGAPRQLALGRTSGRAAATGTDGVEVIDLESGALVKLDTRQQGKVTSTRFAAGGRVATLDGASILVFEASGKLVRQVQPSGASEAIDLSPSGRLLAVADSSGLAILDIDRGTERAKVTPCAGARHADVAWTDDERRLVVACGERLPQAPARVLMLSPDGAAGLELIRGVKSGDTFRIAPRGERLGVGSATLGGFVFDAATGKELFRVPPPATRPGAPLFSRDGERLLFHNGALLEELSVLDRAGRVVSPAFRTSAQPLHIGLRGRLLALWDMSPVAYLDPATGAARLDPPGLLSPDGTTFLADPAMSSQSFELVDGASGARRRVDTNSEIPGSASFSSHGDWVAFPVTLSSSARPGHRYEHLVRLYDAHTGAPGKTFSFGATPHPYSFSDDDKLFAMITDNGRCQVNPRCEVVQVLDVQSGQRLAAIDHDRENVYGTKFLPGGKLLLVDDRVHDARSGRLAWTIPAGFQVASTVSSKGQLLLTATGSALVVDAATGKKVRELEPLDRVLAAGDDGAFLLTQRANEIALWDSASWTKKPTALKLPPLPTSVVLARDGRLAWFVDGNDLLAYRFADGRTLRRALPGLAVDVTDEGVFDPTQVGPSALLTRLGPDVEQSPMAPSARAAGKLRHPGLLADFIAGKPVSPKP